MAGPLSPGWRAAPQDVLTPIISADGAVAGVVDQSGRNQTSPYILDQSAIPRILPSSGSSNATGQITLTTALPYQPSGVVWLYLPAGVVTAGDQGTGAKLYSVIFSSTTVCQIQGTGIVTANVAYTQTTAADITLATIVVPGGAMGANGSVRSHSAFACANNANNKISGFVFGGPLITTNTTTTAAGAAHFLQIFNRGGLGQQITRNITSTNATGLSARTSIDTSINQNLTFTGQLAVATDFIILEGYTVEVLPS